MVEGGGGPAFPVVFFDGEREMNIGDVRINPSLEYKPFQLMLSQKIGISPNQISIYLVDRKKTPRPPFSEERRRIPITGKVNFSAICRQKECCFLVVLKRSRKSRNRKERLMNGLELGDFLPENEFSRSAVHPVPENLILLRRNQPTPFYDQLTQSEIDDLNGRLQDDLKGRLQSLRVQTERYQMEMARGTPDFGWDADLNLDSLPTIDDVYDANPSWLMMTNNETRKGKVFCEECRLAEETGTTASFHPCANDAVITQFSTRLGPINRPKKSLF